MFPYVIAVPTVILTPFSKAYLVKRGEDSKKIAKKYIRLSRIFGWWAIRAVELTLKYIRLNRQGGLDVTEDIMLNLTEEGLQNRIVKIKQVKKIFVHLNSSDKKELLKALKRFAKEYPPFRECWLGYFINVADGEKPIFS